MLKSEDLKHSRAQVTHLLTHIPKTCASAESFREFDDTYRMDNDIQLDDSFEISVNAVKKQSRIFKSILKLDKNFHIYIHGKKDLIEQGVEKDGRKFYKNLL